jgi:hypothetical protein
VHGSEFHLQLCLSPRSPLGLNPKANYLRLASRVVLLLFTQHDIHAPRSLIRRRWNIFPFRLAATHGEIKRCSDRERYLGQVLASTPTKGGFICSMQYQKLLTYLSSETQPPIQSSKTLRRHSQRHSPLQIFATLPRIRCLSTHSQPFMLQHASER